MQTAIHTTANREVEQSVHRLQPLLAPRSIALVGASLRAESAGNDMVLQLLQSGFGGRVYAVNPKYDQVAGIPCYPSLFDLPETVDLCVMAVGNRRLEDSLREATACGVRAAVLFGSVHLEDDTDPPLRTRLRAIAEEAGLLLCGGNSMGFYNLDHSLFVFPQHIHRKLVPGAVTYISQSGSALTGLLWNNRKLRFNLAISSGQEITNTVADYMDYALEQPSTRVIALFLEAVREPEKFVAALRKANEKEIPVVVLKAGRTEAAAALAMSHSGAIAGNDAAYQAVFDRYGVTRVNSLDELASTTLLMSMSRRPAAGGIASILDSGGEREILMDLANDFGVTFAEINDETVDVLRANLDPELQPINPLDAWGTGHNYEAIFENCWQALVDDSDTAMGVFVADLTSHFWLHEGFARVCRKVAVRTTKPVVMATNHVGSEEQNLAMRLADYGIPVLDGIEPALKAIRHALNYRDFLAQQTSAPPERVVAGTRRRWMARLSTGEALDEYEALCLLDDYGVPVQAAQVATTLDEALAAADTIGYPVVVKTAMPDIQHKSDVGGVKLGIAGPDELRQAYSDLNNNLGPRVLVAGMADGRVEMAFGVISDPQFGPIVMVASGGIFIEVLRDRQVTLAPLDMAAAMRSIDSLTTRPLLDAVRGKEACDVEAVAHALTRLSVLAADLGDWIQEMDVNPVKVGPNGCVAVDALVIPKSTMAFSAHLEVVP